MTQSCVKRTRILIQHMSVSNLRILKLKMVLCMLLLSFSDVFAKEPAEPASLTLKPSQCVALREGQECHIDVKFEWSSKENSDFCLLSSNNSQPIRCWKRVSSGTHHQKFIVGGNVMFFLENLAQRSIVAKAELEIAWVYKKNDRSRLSWRLF